MSAGLFGPVIKYKRKCLIFVSNNAFVQNIEEVLSLTYFKALQVAECHDNYQELSNRSCATDYTTFSWTC